jgi:adenylate kinase
MWIVLFGPPGSGKGTQGALLADRLGWKRLATGDVLRAAVQAGTPLGQEARRYMDAGELVPDEVILGIVDEWLAREAESAPGVVFDGFPRTVAQAQGLEERLARRGRAIDAVVTLDVSDDEIVRRLSGRRICERCGAVFHIDTLGAAATACPVCGGALRQREDDREETVRRRLEVYRQTTAPLVAWYEARGVPIHIVDGQRPVHAVFDDIVARLGVEPSPTRP